MWAGWFRLKSITRGTQQEGGTATGPASRGMPTGQTSDVSADTPPGAAGRASQGSAGARRAAADAGTAVAAYLVVWASLGPALFTDPPLWFLALAAGAAVILRAAGSVLRRKPQFSTPADRVTLGRATLVACCAAETVVGLIAGTGTGTSSLVVVLGTAAFLLDAVDGRLARLTGSATVEGARLDSDTDAALVLVLSCTAAGTFGLWPLGIGLMYYAFLAAAWFRPSLKNPLPSSTVRRVIGAAQPAALLFALLPGVPPSLGAMVLGTALGLLAYSFGRDVVELERLRRASPDPVAGCPASCAETPAGA